MTSLLFIPLLGWACLALFLGACSTKVSGGSVGTDNPQAAVSVSDVEGVPVFDSVSVRVWRVDQNPILNPTPVWDTVLLGSSVFTIHSEALGLDDEEWNIEAKSKDGRCGLVRNLSISDSGNIIRDGVIVSDTFAITLQANGSSIIMESDTTRDTTSWNSGVVVVDTLYSRTDYFYEGVIPPVVNTVPSSSKDGVDSTAYLVVLGTSIVLTVNGTGTPPAEVLGLPPGQYTMVSMSATGVVMRSWNVTISP